MKLRPTTVCLWKSTRIVLHSKYCFCPIDRFHVTSQHFRSPYLCTAQGLYYICKDKPHQQFLLLKKNTTAAEANLNANPDVGIHPPLSEYAKKLEPRVKQRYLEKISAIGIDPVLIESKNFQPDCLPPVESTDLLFYLVLETSFYTQQQFKAFRSLEAYNQMVSGFITSAKGHIIANKFVVLAKVRHSQRMNDSLIPIWIITEKDGTILSAHCLGCKAGLAESCSHIASVLFYVEAWTKINKKRACTQVKCSWLLPTFVDHVEYARARDINFIPAKKMKADLDSKISKFHSKFKSKIWCPDSLTLKSFFSLSDSRSFALLANAGFFTNSRSLALSLLFAAWSRSVWPVFLLCLKFRVGTQSTLNLSHDFAAFPETKCFPHTRSFSKMVSVRSSLLIAEIQRDLRSSDNSLASCP